MGSAYEDFRGLQYTSSGASDARPGLEDSPPSVSGVEGAGPAALHSVLAEAPNFTSTRT